MQTTDNDLLSVLRGGPGARQAAERLGLSPREARKLRGRRYPLWVAAVVGVASAVVTRAGLGVAQDVANFASFTAGDAASAQAVNDNLLQLKTWIERKTGDLDSGCTDGDCPVTATGLLSAQGGATVTGNTQTTTLTATGTVTAGAAGDGDVLLQLNTERSWQLRSAGTGSSTNLLLDNVSGNNKSFIVETDGDLVHRSQGGTTRFRVEGDTGRISMPGLSSYERSCSGGSCTATCDAGDVMVSCGAKSDPGGDDDDVDLTTNYAAGSCQKGSNDPSDYTLFVVCLDVN